MLTINETLVRQMITAQFPQWQDLPVVAITPNGWDNRTFFLGADKLARLPSAGEYAAQVEKEQRWLPKLAPLLPLQIPTPLAMGKPTIDYPYPWSIYRWIDGETVAFSSTLDLEKLAMDLGNFLVSLQSIDTQGGPLPGEQNFYRGGDLSIYSNEVEQAFQRLKGKIDTNLALNIWESALKTHWQKLPVWVHGDISSGNLLVKNGKLSAVIDFGLLAVGDPACDLAIAWTLFKGKSRDIFRQALNVDDGTWLGGCAWALWKAAILSSGLAKSNANETEQSWLVLEEILRTVR